MVAASVHVSRREDALVARITTAGSSTSVLKQAGSRLASVPGGVTEDWYFDLGAHGLTYYELGTVPGGINATPSVRHAKGELMVLNTRLSTYPIRPLWSGHSLTFVVPLRLIPRLGRKFTWSASAYAIENNLPAGLADYRTKCPYGAAVMSVRSGRRSQPPSSHMFLLAAQRAWRAGTGTAGGYLQDGPWMATLTSLREAEHASHLNGPSLASMRSAVSALRNLLKLPDAMLTSAEMNAESRDIRDVNSVLQTPKLYVGQSTAASATSGTRGSFRGSTTGSGGMVFAEPGAASWQDYLAEIRHSITQGTLPGVAAVSEVSLKCSHFEMQIGAAFTCSLLSPTGESGVLVGEITAPRGTLGREWVGSTTFLCSQLTGAEQALLRSTGQPCLEGSGDAGSSGPGLGTSSSGAPGSIARSLMYSYFSDIDASNYTGAWLLLTPQLQLRQGSERQFMASLSTTSDTGVKVSVVTQTVKLMRLHVRFTSHQAPSDGPGRDSCDQWRLTYTLEASAGKWLIAQTVPTSGAGYRPC